MNAIQSKIWLKLQMQIDELSKPLSHTTKELIDGFRDEYCAVSDIDTSKTQCQEFCTALQQRNREKNRYGDILPNEATRVVLKPLNACKENDYINANHIDGQQLFDIPIHYIATQGPMENTVEDFWHMVWQERCSCIVMLCNLFENKRGKCFAYFPTNIGTSVHFGNFTVTLDGVSDNDGCPFRHLRVKCGHKTRVVTQFHFTKWPDHGLPDETGPLFNIVQSIDPNSPVEGPVVVHCSAGVGRTGTFIAIHVAFCLFQLGRWMPLRDIVARLKDARSFMVDGPKQYRFAHHALSQGMQRVVEGQLSNHKNGC